MLLAKVPIADYFDPAKKYNSLGGLISQLLPNILIIAGVIFFILTVLAGAAVVFGAGGSDPQTQERAKSFLTYAVIGLVIIIASYWILQIISYVTFDSLKGLVGG